MPSTCLTVSYRTCVKRCSARLGDLTIESRPPDTRIRGHSKGPDCIIIDRQLASQLYRRMGIVGIDKIVETDGFKNSLTAWLQMTP